jgi:hypothetical protein
VRIRLTVPKEEILADFQPAQEDVYVAIREAFDAARRNLEDAERARPGHVRGRELTRRRPRPRPSASEESETAPGEA